MSLPEPTRTAITNINIITSGPETDGKHTIRTIAEEIVQQHVMTAKMRRIMQHNYLLQQGKWAEFLAAVDYQLPPSIRFHNTLDVGMLPEVTEMATILLKGPLFHFICFNLMQDTTEPVQATVNQDKHQKTHYTLWQTAKQLVSQVVETVTTFNWQTRGSERVQSKEYQTTAIVGVYSGENPQVDTKLPQVDADLKKVVQSCGSEKAVRYCYRHNDQMIFPLDLQRKSYDDTRVKEVVGQVLDKRKDCSCPITNSACELILLLHFSRKILNLSECRSVARYCGVPTGDLPNILKNVHEKLGLILYFREVPKMKNLVICHSRELVTPLESFTVTALNGTQRCPQDPAIVRKTGEIPQSLIDELVSREEHTEKLSVSCLLELLKHYKFLSEAERANGTAVYFMPCLLQPLSSFGGRYTKDRNATSLLFCFKRSPHSSLFTALIAQLARKWKLASNDRYKNFVAFIADKRLLTEVELWDRGNHFQLVVVKSSLSDQWYSQIRHEVQRALHLVKIRYAHLSSEGCQIGFYCPRSCLRTPQSPHCAMVRIAADGIAYLQCPVRNCQRGRVLLETRMETWFTGEQVSVH